MNNKNSKLELRAFFILLLSISPYLLNLNSFWLMDDVAPIDRGTQVSWERLFHDPYGESEKFFRPLSIALSMIDGKIWGVSALGYRITNYLLFFLCGLLVYQLVKIFSSHTIALFSAFIFLIHPIQVGTVVWLSGRVDILSAFFLLAAEAVFLRDNKRTLLADSVGYLLFVLALLTKESALMFPIVLFAGFRARGNSSKDSLLKTIPSLIIFVVYVALRVAFNYLPGTDYYDPKKFFFAPVLIIRNFMTLALNIIYIVIPLWNPFDVLKKDYPYADSLFKLLFNQETAPVIFFIVTGMLFIAMLLWKGTSQPPDRKPLVFALVWFLAFIAPTFHVMGNMGGLRYFFTSCTTVFWAIVLMGVQLQTKMPKKVFDSIIVSFLTLCIIMNIREQLAWKNAFDTAENITSKAIEHARDIPFGSTLLIYDLPEYSPSGRLVYPEWDEYSLPMSVKLISGLSVLATHSKSPSCAEKNIVCVSASSLISGKR